MKVQKYSLATFALGHPELNNVPFKKYVLLEESFGHNILGMEGSIEAVPILGDALYRGGSDVRIIDIDYYSIIQDYLKVSLNRRAQDIEALFELVPWEPEEFIDFTAKLRGKGTGLDDLLNKKDVITLGDIHKRIVYPGIIKPLLIDNRDNIEGMSIITLPALVPYKGAAIWVEASEDIIDAYYAAMAKLSNRKLSYIVQSREIAKDLQVLSDTGGLKLTLTLYNTTEIIKLIKERLWDQLVEQ